MVLGSRKGKLFILAASLLFILFLVQINLSVIRDTSEGKKDMLVLADRGKTAYTVYTPQENDPMVLHAARELANDLGQMTGAEFKFAAGPTPPSGPLLVVKGGNSADSADEDGFSIRTSGEQITIEGNSSRGAMYGVYYFLDRLCGIRWFSADYTYVPQRDTFALPALDITEAPRFRYREIFQQKDDDEWFRAHNLLNGKSHYRLKEKSAPYLDSWSDFWPEGTHNFEEIVPDKSYIDSRSLEGGNGKDHQKLGKRTGFWTGKNGFENQFSKMSMPKKRHKVNFQKLPIIRQLAAGCEESGPEALFPYADTKRRRADTS